MSTARMHTATHTVTCEVSSMQRTRQQDSNIDHCQVCSFCISAVALWAEHFVMAAYAKALLWCLVQSVCEARAGMLTVVSER